MSVRRFGSVAALIALAGDVRAEVDFGRVEDVELLSLSDLLEQPVTSASRYAQQPGNSPILVSSIDADLIQRMGYRTIGDALRGTRGVYTSNDRNYSYLGARGFSLPGDYNTRFAVSIDNHRMNDPVYGQGNTGSELGVPMIAIDRIEMIRGGAWSVHGESALLGAVQVVTATGATRPGLHVTATSAATLETYEDPANRANLAPRNQDVAASYGLVERGFDLFVAGAYSFDPGLSAIYMPELVVVDEPCVGSRKQLVRCNGVTHGGDAEEVGALFASIKKRDFTFRTLASRRRKQASTASYASLIGDTIETFDDRLYGDLEYARTSERGDLVLRVTGDYYEYYGSYPYVPELDPSATDSIGRVFNLDGASAVWWGAEARGRLTEERYGRYLSHLEIGGGAEARTARGSQTNGDAFATGLESYLDRTDRVDRAAVFGHASARAFDHVVGFVAVRGDYYPDTVGAVANPQLGFVLDGGELGRIRASLARGHRAPNVYEKFFAEGTEDIVQPKLGAEQSETREVSLERYLGTHMRLLVVAFRQDVSNLITLTETADEIPVFQNVGGMRSYGVETELEGRWDRLRLRATYTRQRARTSDGQVPANSPESLATLTVLAPIAGGRAEVGVDSWFVNERLSFDGAALEPMFMTNVVMTVHRVADRMDLTLGLSNLFDQRGGTPGSAEHRQAVIPHDPRTVWARLRVELP